MKSPNLEAMIEAECVQGRGLIYRRNLAYKYILDQLSGFYAFDYLTSSELHAMINTGMGEPSYSMLAHELYLLIKDKYILAGYTVSLTADGIVEKYLTGNLSKLLTSLLEGLKGYDFNLPG